MQGAQPNLLAGAREAPDLPAGFIAWLDHMLGRQTCRNTPRRVVMWTLDRVRIAQISHPPTSNLCAAPQIFIVPFQDRDQHVFVLITGRLHVHPWIHKILPAARDRARANGCQGMERSKTVNTVSHATTGTCGWESERVCERDGEAGRGQK